eukprot:scaffold8721_cov80-Phaeocystis_antarctica.AAC.39
MGFVAAACGRPDRDLQVEHQSSWRGPEGLPPGRDSCWWEAQNTSNIAASAGAGRSPPRAAGAACGLCVPARVCWSCRSPSLAKGWHGAVPSQGAGVPL